MRTQVEFQSSKFPSYGTAEEGVNEEAGVYGKRLAEYLRDQLTAKGIGVRTIFPEDWGWMVEIEHDGNFPLWIGCNSIDDGFLCFIEPSKPVIRKGLKKIDVRESVENLADALYSILQADEGITEVRWVDEAD